MLAEGSQIHHYEIIEHLGGGGMGVVYKALDTRLERVVALKFLPPAMVGDDEANARFEREAKSAAAIQSGKIVTVYDIGSVEKGGSYIAMEYVDGVTLKQHLANGALTPSEASRIASDVAEGLSVAHQNGITHRDIKPANIMVTKGGRAKILDFGLAKLSSTAIDLTTADRTVGTAAYMSPEQARGENATSQSDLWSLGVVMHEMITGRKPFAGDYSHAVMYAIVHEEPDLRTDVEVPAAYADIVKRCLQKDAGNRPRSAGEIVDSLGLSSHTVTQSRIAMPATAGKRFPPMLIGLAGVMLLVLALWVVGGRRVAEASSQQLLAVLPFGTLGDNDDAVNYSAGLVETLTSKLSQLRFEKSLLSVIPASELPATLKPSNAFTDFGATLAVTGNMQFENTLIRVTLNLIDAKTTTQLDSRILDYGSGSALALQDSALFLVVDMLNERLAPEDRQSIAAASSVSPIANDLFLKGLGRLRSRQSLADIDAAIQLLSLAVEEDPTFAESHSRLAEAYWQKYRLTEDAVWIDRALASGESAISLDSLFAPAHVTIGAIHAGRGLYELALASFARAQELDPKNAAVYRQRARAYRSLGRFEDAEVEYKKAVEFEKNYWLNYAHIGGFYYRQGRFDDALDEYQKGLNLAPSNQTLLSNIGATYFELGRMADAIESFQNVLRSNPDHARAKSNLGTALFYNGRYAEAAQLYEERLSLAPNDASVAGFLADTYHWMDGRENDEVRTYRRAISLTRAQLATNPADIELLSNLATYYSRLAEPDSALAIVADITDRFARDELEPSTSFGLGDVFEQVGNRPEAVLWIESALRRGYGSVELRHSPWLADLIESQAGKHLLEL